MIDCFLRFMVMGIARTADLIMRSWGDWPTSGNLPAHMR